MVLSPRLQDFLEEAYSFGCTMEELEPEDVTAGLPTKGRRLVSSFLLPAGQTLSLEGDLFLYCTGDVRIDGDISGSPVSAPGEPGQSLVILAKH